MTCSPDIRGNTKASMMACSVCLVQQQGCSILAMCRHLQHPKVLPKSDILAAVRLYLSAAQASQVSNLTGISPSTILL